MDYTKIRLDGYAPIDLHKDSASPSDPYTLEGVDGLGPPETDVFIATLTNESRVYRGRRSRNRQIVVRMGLNPDHGIDQTAAELREDVYGLLTPNDTDDVTFALMDDDVVVAQVTGYVSKIEITPFSKDPQVQVTIECDSPYLEAEEEVSISGFDTDNPDITNPGTVATGFRMEIVFTAGSSGWTITRDVIGDHLTVLATFLTGDKLIIDTRPNQRGLWLVRAAVTYDLIAGLSADSTWLVLYRGVNGFSTSSGDFNSELVNFKPRYWGA